MDSIPKTSILLRRGDTPPKKVPSICVWNRAFKALDLSIGGELGETGDVVEDQFDGDGKKTSFKLSVPPLRPLLSVESPPEKKMKEGGDFIVNYQTGIMSLEDPPEKGKKNVYVRYHSGKGAGEVKGIRLRLAYNVDVWASDAEEESSLVNQVVSLLLIQTESLSEKGIRLSISRGRDLTARDGAPDGSFCKRIECVAEANMLVKLGMPRIEKIELKSPNRT